MDTQKVEQYAGVIRKVSKGLKVWNIIGIVGNAFGLLGMAILLIPQVQEELAKVKNPYLTKENIGFGIAVLVVFLLICIFYTTKLEKVLKLKYYLIKIYYIMRLGFLRFQL